MDIIDLQILIDHIREADLILVGSNGEHLLSKLLNIQISNSRQNIGSTDIFLSGSRRMEVHGIRQHRSKQKTSQIWRDRNLVFTKDSCHNRSSRSYNLITECYRLRSGKIVNPVMVNNFQNLGFFDGIHRLGKFIVVHQNKLPLWCIHDVVPGDIAYQLIILIHNRISAVTIAEHFDTDVFR